jgi:hypothetical protein
MSVLNRRKMIMDEFDKIKEKYSVVVPVESINNIDIIAVDYNDLKYLINKIEKQQNELNVVCGTFNLIEDLLDKGRNKLNNLK